MTLIFIEKITLKKEQHLEIIEISLHNKKMLSSLHFILIKGNTKVIKVPNKKFNKTNPKVTTSVIAV